MAAIPIWKDKVIDLGAASVEFRLTVGGNTIYSGKAIARPGESNAKVRINDICADYLENVKPTLSDRTFTSFYLPSFVVEKKSGGSWTTVDTVLFYNDWSYNYGFTGNVLSDPINGKVTTAMYILSSAKEISSNVTASYKKSGGSVTTRTATVSPTPAYGTCVFDVGAVSDTVQITVNGKVYKVVDGCDYDFALIYVNAYGGWDQLLVQGNTLEADSVDRHIRGREYLNTTSDQAGMVDYVNEITKSWILNTGLLTDAEASRMHHLLNSPLVYLFQFAGGGYSYPVIIKTDTCEYKTYKNQGNKMFNYQFTVELAQNRIRR